MGYDVIIVGARCAGGALATLLARSGTKTLILEADTLPSGMSMSTPRRARDGVAHSPTQ
jgi:flavin-dependent dehydrogenase